MLRFAPAGVMRIAAATAGAALAAFLAAPAPAAAAEAWCRDDLVTLQGDVCYAPGPAPLAGERRTLVIFLHGLTDEGSGWQLTMQEGMQRAGKALHFSMLAPRGRNGLGPGRKQDVIAWPTSEDGRKEAEDEIWARIDRARAEAEAREAAPFEDVFVVGFSNGAYYASSLALRGRLANVDGYAVIAGGSAATAPSAKGDARKPVFIGVASKDTTAKKGRELDRALARAGWPHRTSEKKVGHVVSDDHLVQALQYLRAKARGGSPSEVAPAAAAPEKPSTRQGKAGKGRAGSKAGRPPGRRAK